MTIRFGRVVAEAAQHVDAHLLGTAEDGVPLEAFQQTTGPVLPLEEHLDVPRLVVDAGADDVHVLLRHRPVATAVPLPASVEEQLDDAADLGVAALYAVAQADRVDAAVLVGRPSIHRHGVGVVEQQHAVGGDLGHVVAEGQHLRNVALSVHDAAGTQRIPDALVDSILEGDVDVALEGFEATDARGVEDVMGALEGLAAVHRRGQRRRQLVGFDVAPGQLRDHVEVATVDVVEGERGVGQLRDGQDVPHQAAGEADAAGTDDGDFDGCHDSVFAGGLALPGVEVRRIFAAGVPAARPFLPGGAAQGG